MDACHYHLASDATGELARGCAKSQVSLRQRRSQRRRRLGGRREGDTEQAGEQKNHFLSDSA